MDQINTGRLCLPVPKGGDSQRPEVPFDLEVDQDYPLTLNSQKIL